MSNRPLPARLLCHAARVAATLVLSAATTASADIYTWDGGAGTTTWTDANNWNPDNTVAPLGVTQANRLNINSPQKVIYDYTLAPTVYTGDTVSGGGRGLVIGSGTNARGEMEIAAGSFSTLGAASGDVIGNGQGSIGTLTVNGGTFIGTAAGTGVGIGGGPTSTLNVQAGTATIATLTLNATTATVNLSGTGVLEVNSIGRVSGTANINFDGGTLRARTDTSNFVTGLNTATINSGGVTIDTATRAITIAQPLLAGTGSGGITKAGTGTLTLSGANSYTGQTSVASGTLALASGGALGSSSAVSVASGAALRINASSTGSGRTVTINGTGANFFGALQGAGSSSVAWAGDVVLGSNAARIGGGEGGTLDVNGVISDGGNGFAVLFSRAPNSTTVLNSQNTYSGDTQLFPNSSTVTLRMGITNAINSASRVTFSTAVAGTGYVDLNGFDQNVRALVDTFTANMIVTNGGSNDAVLTLSEPNAVNTATFDGWIEDGATNKVSLIKSGAGTQILSGANSYTGTTTVSAGTLLVNGSLATASAVSVASGAMLGGSGTIGGPTSILGGGILSPGNSPGTLTVNNTLTLADTSILAFEINPTDQTIGGGVNDLITGVTTLTLGGTLNLSGSGDFTAVTQGTTWRLFNYTGSLTLGTLTIGTAPTLADGNSFSVDTSTGGQVNLVVVPEPSGAIMLAGLGLAAAGWLACRRRR